MHLIGTMACFRGVPPSTADVIKEWSLVRRGAEPLLLLETAAEARLGRRPRSPCRRLRLLGCRSDCGRVGLVALVVELLLRQGGLLILLGYDLEGLVQAENVAAALGLEFQPETAHLVST